MHIDIAWLLMGDPGSSHRRPPTAEEALRQGRLLGYEPKRIRRRRAGPRPPADLRLLTLAPGQELRDLTRKECEVARLWLRRNNRHCRTNKQADGRFRLLRTR